MAEMLGFDSDGRRGRNGPAGRVIFNRVSVRSCWADVPKLARKSASCRSCSLITPERAEFRAVNRDIFNRSISRIRDSPNYGDSLVILRLGATLLYLPPRYEVRNNLLASQVLHLPSVLLGYSSKAIR